MKRMTICIFILLTVILATPSYSLAFTFNQLTSKDTDSHWAQEYTDELAAMGILNGYMGYTNPDSIITRGEFTALITRAFNFDTGKDPGYTDIDKSHIFYQNICAAHNAGIIDGFSDNTFRPDNMITREEIMLIISRLTSYETPPRKAEFTDIVKGYEYINQLSKVVDDGIIKGYPDSTFRPYGKTTRAEACAMIVESMKKYMPQIDDAKAENTASGYLDAYFAGENTYTKGSAYNDGLYIGYTYQKSRELGYEIQNDIYNIVITSVSHQGPVSHITAQYDAVRSVNGQLKKYRGKSDIKLLTQKGKTFVYEHNRTILTDGFINMVWEVYTTPPSYQTKSVNTVSPTCFSICAKRSSNSAESIYTENGKEVFFNSTLNEEYVNYAKSNNYNLWAMYKTDFDPNTASALLNSPSARKQTWELLLHYILKYSLDGINFDFENMYPTDKGAYTNHVREITLMAHTLGAVVSVDITRYEPTSANWSMCFDRDALAKTADYIILMAYDQFYAGSQTAGPVSSIPWTERAVIDTLKEVPSDKLVLGIPFYTRCWQVHNMKAVSSEAISMATANRYIAENNAKYEYDSEYQLSKYTWSKDGKSYVMWLENADTVSKRVELAKKYNLAGVAAWRRGFETVDVWDAISQSTKN